MSKLFNLGHILITEEASKALQRSGTTSEELLLRHQRGDWGNVDNLRASANNRAIKDGVLIEGERVFSGYLLPRGVEIWVITEPSRSVWVVPQTDQTATTVLLPQEYESAFGQASQSQRRDR